MAEKSEVIRRLRAGQSIREINRETGIHRATIRLVQEAAIRLDWLIQQKSIPNEKSILEALGNGGEKQRSKNPHPLDI